MNTTRLSTLLALVLAASASAQSINYHVQVNNPAKFDSGEESLNTAPGQEVATDKRPLLNLPRVSQGNNRPDGALQGVPGPLVNTSSGVGVDGVPAGQYAPPDTSLAVGPNHIVQWVNVNFAVYNKSGVMLAGYPKPGNAFWSGFGGPCETRNDGDPIIQYDAAADRWIASQFTTNGPTYYQCLAISQTGDPTGLYYRYAYSFTDGFPDYPKISVWKNAYFASYNMFSSAVGGWKGPRICAYDRTAMLAGQAAVQECFNPGSAYGSLLPSDIEGGTSFAPPSNTGFFADYGNNALLLWKFTPDFVTPANATLTGPTSLAAASFSPACNGGTCVPQPNTTTTLDTLADRLMYRLAYRNLGSYESMLITQSVNTAIVTSSGTVNSVGVRWYEVRNPSTAPTIYQQGTYAPDETYRWMSSGAIDKVGNFAIGYSASSKTVVPSIRYTGRETTDALNTLQTEQNVFTGGGSQVNLSRWGDYSSMRIDPADDCTFWYSTEYIPSDGSFNWHTRIASFKFNSCTASPAADFTVSATPTSATVNAGSPASYTVSVGALNGYSGTVTLSVSGLPAGAGASFSPTSVTGSGNSALTVTTASTTAGGTSTLTITASDGTITKTTTVSLTVRAQDFTLSVSPASQSVLPGGITSNYTVSVSPINGYAGTPVYTVINLPGGASANVVGSQFTINSGSAAPGSYTFTIQGQDSTLGITRTTTATLVIGNPSFNLSLSPSTASVKRPNGNNGNTANYTATVSAVGGFTGPVTVSVPTTIPGVTFSVNPSTINTSGSATVSARVISSAQKGTYQFTVRAVNGATTKTVTGTLVIN